MPREAIQKFAEPITFPELPNPNEPIHEILKRAEEHYQRQRTFRDAATWQQISVNEMLPIGIALMGDPHIDDPGCNLPLLRRDINLISGTEGCYAINVGDYTNNWVGRLTRLFANHELSQASARRLIKWLLIETGINWLAVILGNHDEWNEGGEIIRQMCSTRVNIPVHDWQAKLELVFPNKATCRINAAHDFKGRSIYTPVHGLKREAIWHQDGAHLMVAGHIHFGGIEQCELPGGHNPWLARVRGYKEMDPHALVNGYHEGQHFASVLAIVDPLAEESDRVLLFSSLAQGIPVLKAMRAQALEQAPVKVRSSRRPSSKSDTLPAQSRKQSRKRRAASSSRRQSSKPKKTTSRGSRTRQARA